MTQMKIKLLQSLLQAIVKQFFNRRLTHALSLFNRIMHDALNPFKSTRDILGTKDSIIFAKENMSERITN